MNHGRIDGRTTKGVHKHPTDGYNKDNPNNLGNLPYGQIDAVITSPPFTQQVSGQGTDAQITSTGKTRARGFSSFGETWQGYAPSSGNIGNLKGESYLAAMLQVYSECFKRAKPRE
jgi:hypothetical protein